MQGQNINKQIVNIAEFVTEFPCLLGHPVWNQYIFYIYQISSFIRCRNYTDKTNGILYLKVIHFCICFLILIHAYLNSFSCIKQYFVRTLKRLNKLVHISSPFCGISDTLFHQYLKKNVTVRTTKLWNRKTTFGLIVQCAQTHFT